MIAKVLVSLLLVVGPAVSFPSDRAALAHFGLITRPLTSSPSTQSRPLTSSPSSQWRSPTSPSSTQSRPRTYNPPSLTSSYSAPPSRPEKQPREPERSYGPPQSQEEEKSKSFSFSEPEYSGQYPARTPYQPSKPEGKEDDSKKKNFVHKGRSFAYKFDVQDGDSGNQYAHQSQSDGEITTGMYTVQLPDGRLQTVKYSADADTGFQVNVEYQGVPFYPEDKSAQDVTVYKLSPKNTYVVPGRKGDEDEKAKDESKEKIDSYSSSRSSSVSQAATSQSSGSRQNSQRRQKSSISSVSSVRKEERQESDKRAPSRTYQKPLRPYSPAKTEEVKVENEEVEETDEKEISQRHRGSQIDSDEESKRIINNSRRTYKVPEKITPKEDSEENEGSSSYHQEQSYAEQVNEEDSGANRFASYQSSYIPPSQTYETVALEIIDKSTKSTSHALRSRKEDSRERQPVYAQPGRGYGVPISTIETSSDTDSEERREADEPSKSYGAPQEERKDEIRNSYFPPKTIYGAPASNDNNEDFKIQQTYLPPRNVVLKSKHDSSVESVQNVPVEEENTSNEEEEVSKSIYFSPRVVSSSDKKSKTSETVSRTYGLPEENEEETQSKEPNYWPSRVYGVPFTSQDGSDEADKPKFVKQEKSRSSSSTYAPPSQTYGAPVDVEGTQSDADDEDVVSSHEVPSRTYGVPSSSSEDIRRPETISFPPIRTYGVPDESDEKGKVANDLPSRTYGVPARTESSKRPSTIYSPPRNTYGVPGLNAGSAVESGDAEDNDETLSRTYGIPEDESEDTRNTQQISSPPSSTYGIPDNDEDKTDGDSNDNGNNDNEDESNNSEEKDTYDPPARSNGTPEDGEDFKATQSIRAPPSRTYGIPAASLDKISDSTVEDNDDESNNDNDSDERKVHELPRRTYGVPEDLEEDNRPTQPINASPSKTYGIPEVGLDETSGSSTDGGDENDYENKSSSEENTYELPSQTYGAPEEDDDDFSSKQPINAPPIRTYGVPEVDVDKTADETYDGNDDSNNGDDDSGEDDENRVYKPPSETYGLPEDTEATQPIYKSPSRIYGVPDVSADETTSSNTEQGSEDNDEDDDSQANNAYEPPSRAYGVPENNGDDSRAPKPIYAPPRLTYGVPDVSADESGADETRADDTDQRDSDDREDSDENGVKNTYQLPSRTYGVPVGDGEDSTSPEPSYIPPTRTYSVPGVNEDETSVDGTDESDDEYVKESDENEGKNSYEPPSRTYGVPEDEEEDSKAPEQIYGPPRRAYGVPDVSGDEISDNDTDESDDEEDSDENEEENAYQPPSRIYGVPVDAGKDYRAPEPIYAPPRRTYGVPDVSTDEISVDEANESNERKDSNENDKINEPSITYGVPEDSGGDSKAPEPIYAPPSRTYGAPDASVDETGVHDTVESDDDDREDSDENGGSKLHQSPSRTYGVPEDDGQDSKAQISIDTAPRRTYGAPDISADETSIDDADRSDKDDRKESDENERSKSRQPLSRTYGAPEDDGKDSKAPVPIYIAPSRSYGAPDISTDETSVDFTDESNDDDREDSDENEGSKSQQPPARTYGVPEDDGYDSKRPVPIYTAPSRTYGAPDVSADKTSIDDTEESDDDDRKDSDENEGTKSNQPPSRTYGVPEDDGEDSKTPEPISAAPRRTYGVPDVSTDETNVYEADESNETRNNKENGRKNTSRQPSRTYGEPEDDGESSKAPETIYAPPSRKYGAPDVNTDETSYDNTDGRDEKDDHPGESRDENEGANTYQPLSLTYGVPADDKEGSKVPEPIYGPPRRTYGVPDVSVDEATVDNADESHNDGEDSDESDKINTYQAPSETYGVPEDDGEHSGARKPIYTPPSRTYGVPSSSADGAGDGENDDSGNDSEEDETNGEYKSPSDSYGVPEDDDEDSRGTKPISSPITTYGVPDVKEDEAGDHSVDENDNNKDISDENEEIGADEPPPRTYGVPEDDDSDINAVNPIYGPPSRTYGVPEGSVDEESDEDDSDNGDNGGKKVEIKEWRIQSSYLPPISTFRAPSRQYGSPSGDQDDELKSSYSVPPAPTSSEYEPLHAPPSIQYDSPSGDSEEGEKSSYSVPPAPTSSEYEPLYAPPSQKYIAPSDSFDKKLESSPASEIDSDADALYKPLHAPPSQGYGTPKRDDSEERVPEQIRMVRFRSPLRRIDTSNKKPTVYYHPKPIKLLAFNNVQTKSRHTREPDASLVSSRPTRYETHSKDLHSLYIGDDRR